MIDRLIIGALIAAAVAFLAWPFLLILILGG
jgi:hypothetical protein